PFTPDDVLRLHDVSEPRISPEGGWVAYTVSSADTAEDQNHRAVWMTSWDGTRTVRLTNSKQGESAPTWSPDGRWLAFLSSRDDEHTQLWLLDRRGGEGRKVTTLQSDVDDYVWAPDGHRDNNWDVYVMEAVPGATPRQLTTFEGPDDDPDYESRPAWSPDGRSIAYLQGGPLKLIYYAVQKLAVVPAGGGAPRILTATLDRSVASPAWSADGSSVYFLLEDDRTVLLARVPANGGAVERLVSGPR